MVTEEQKRVHKSIDNYSQDSTFIAMCKYFWKRNKARFFEAFYIKKKAPNWHIFSSGEEDKFSYKELNKKFQLIHFGLKYRIVVPLLIWVEKVLKKCNIEEVPNYHYNANLKIFDEAVEETIPQWTNTYLCRGHTPKMRKFFINEHLGPRMIRAAKNAFKMIYLYDTAYREFMNIFMFNIAKKMNEQYKDHEEINHIFYPSANFADVNYYVITKQIGKNKIQLQSVNELNKPNNKGTGTTNPKKV